MATNNGLRFSKETLEATLQNLTENQAIVWIGQAGGKQKLEDLITKLARNFNATIPEQATKTIASASRRWTAVTRNPQVNYKVN